MSIHFTSEEGKTSDNDQKARPQCVHYPEVRLYTRVINPRCACAARVTVVGSVCVCPLLNISPLERLFVTQSVPHTQRAAKVRNFVWFSLKMLRCRARALPSLYGYASDTDSSSATSARKINKQFCQNDGIRDRVTGIVEDHVARPSPSISGVSMRVRTMGLTPPCFSRPGRPDPAYLWPPLASFTLPFATSCPAQRGKADVQSGLPADAASLRETGSVNRYTPRGPVSHRIV